MTASEEGEERLQRPIRAAPALVLLSLLQIVIIRVVALDHAGAIDRPQSQMHGAKRLLAGSRHKQRVGISEEGPILSQRKVFLRPSERGVAHATRVAISHLHRLVATPPAAAARNNAADERASDATSQEGGEPRGSNEEAPA